MSGLVDTLSEDEKRRILEDAAALKAMGVDVGLLHIRARMLRRAGIWGGADPAEVLGNAARAEDAACELFTWLDDGYHTTFDPDLWPSMTPRRLLETRLMVGDVFALHSPTVARKLEELARHVATGDDDALFPLIPARRTDRRGRKRRSFDDRTADRAWLQALDDLEVAVTGAREARGYVRPADIEQARKLAGPRKLTRKQAARCVWFNRYRLAHGEPEVRRPDRGTAAEADSLRERLEKRSRAKTATK